jgi:hypothetical protein
MGMPVAPRPAASATPRPSLRLLLAAGLAMAATGVLPWPAAAADPSESPSAPIVEPTATAVPATPTPVPTAAPTNAVTPQSDPTPAPTPDPTASPTPGPTPGPTGTPPPGTTVSRMLLYRRTAMVRQYTNYWCVPAATQTMVNLIRGTNDRTYATQRRFYYVTRYHNRYVYKTRGNDPAGWAYALRYFTRWRTTYQARSFTNKTQAINAIADSIARTHQPVGVPVWGGTHAWVVVGYRSQADPNDPSKRTVLGLYVSGPLASPRDPWVYEYLSVATFRANFTRYHEWQRRVIWEGRWVIISQ